MPETSVPVDEPIVVTIELGPPGPQGDPGRDGIGADGVTAEQLAAALQTHVEAPEPHPAYDSAPDFALIFENGLI